MKSIEGPKGRLYPDHSPKSVALIGMGPSFQDYLSETLTQELTPEHHDEVWGINMVGNTMRCDLIFWMDDLFLQHAFKPGLIQVLNRHGTAVMSAKRHPLLVRNSFDYPIEEVAQIGCPVFGKPYLNNGVAMAVAYAIWKGVKTLKIYGADFNYPGRDYAESGRACVEAWMTLAICKGISLGLPPHTSLMDVVKDHGIYGYAEQPEIEVNGVIYKYMKATGTAEVDGKYGAFSAPDTSHDPQYEEIRKSVLSGSAQADSATGPSSIRPDDAVGAPIRGEVGGAAEATPPAA